MMQMMHLLSRQVSQLHAMIDRNLSDLRVLVVGPPPADFVFDPPPQPTASDLAIGEPNPATGTEHIMDDDEETGSEFEDEGT